MARHGGGRLEDEILAGEIRIIQIAHRECDRARPHRFDGRIQGALPVLRAAQVAQHRFIAAMRQRIRKVIQAQRRNRRTHPIRIYEQHLAIDHGAKGSTGVPRA